MTAQHITDTANQLDNEALAELLHYALDVLSSFGLATPEDRRLLAELTRQPKPQAKAA